MSKKKSTKMAKKKALKDSGHRKQFASGAVRDREPGKGLFALISPVFRRRLAKHCEAGQVKYGNGRNWEKGMPVQEFLNSADRHLCDFMEGDREEDHLIAVAWNVMCAVHTLEMIERGNLPKELNDLPESYLAAEPTS